MAMKPPSPQAQLARFIAKFTPEVAALGKAVLARLRKLAPPAVGHQIHFGPTTPPAPGLNLI